ncbi:class I SAM-dependent methyltransferase [Arhodomonas sp. AD133]|uniref:class I SAM-dependent methyltransferase n=1 Tax=Arhodomonas sp. AD133 TaxID=3415009 RepID=UPI003EBAACF7
MSERPFDPAQWEQTARRGWDSAALGWKDWAPTIEAGAHVVNNRLVEMARLEAGQKVLDIATGYGEPLVSALERIGATGSAVATDLSPEMLVLARERITELGFANVAFHECNGETLNIPETGFDAALCRWGLMLMADPDACLRRVHELLKPGGYVAMAVFSEPQNSPLLAIAGMTVRREVGAGPSAPGEPNIFRLADAADLQRRFHEAGFGEIALEQVSGTYVYESPEAYTRFIQDVAQDIVRLLEGLSPERQTAIWRTVAEAVQPYQAENGQVQLGFECHCIAARKPAGA